jgi:APA family basic amino acid/polyamine antiporter
LLDRKLLAMEPVEEGHAPKPAAAARGYWRWSKNDFFPEPSFGSWGAYRGALAVTPARLMDRLLAGRSTDAAELGAMQSRSENEMHRCLTWWDIT